MYHASLKFLAATPDEAEKIARQIDFLGGEIESASNACGPLSIAILKEAGMLHSRLSTHDSWLLCARENQVGCDGMNKLRRIYFPPQEFSYKLVSESIRSYDFSADPLKPGDWLYLYARDTGFDHMLVVTRVDENGAVYSVTNLDRGDGFRILEELLYDPDQPETGLFYELTDWKRGILGMSGHTGFLRIRRLEETTEFSEDRALTMLLNPNATWYVLVKEIGSNRILYESMPNQQFHPASMIKIPLAIAVMKTLENRNLGLDALQHENMDDRTLEQLLSALLVKSEEDAADSLLTYLYNHGGNQAVFLTLSDTLFKPRRSTAYELATLLEGLFSNVYLPQDFNAYLLELMATETENDTTLLGVIKQIKPEVVIYNKRGTMTNPTVVGDMGVIVAGERKFVVVICGTPRAAGSITYEEIQESAEAFAMHLAARDFLASAPVGK